MDGAVHWLNMVPYSLHSVITITTIIRTVNSSCLGFINVEVLFRYTKEGVCLGDSHESDVVVL